MDNKTVSVKLLWVQSTSCWDCGGREVVSSISDWDEISKEDFEYLRRYTYSLREKEGRDGLLPLLVVKDGYPIQQRIIEVREYLVSVKEKELKEKLERERKKLEREEKKRLKETRLNKICLRNLSRN